MNSTRCWPVVVCGFTDLSRMPIFHFLTDALDFLIDPLRQDRPEQLLPVFAAPVHYESQVISGALGHTYLDVLQRHGT